MKLRLDLEEFARYVDASRRRVESLATSGGAISPPAELLEELQQNLAELEAAESELAAQHERALRAHERYRELFEFAPGGYFATDPNGMIQDANRTARAMLNLSGNANDAHKPLTAFGEPSDRPEFRRWLARLSLDDASGQQWECWLRPPGAKRFRALISAVPVREDGRTTALRWLLQDVTAGHLAEQAVHEMSRRLLRTQDDERRRIAADLHDLSGPSLSTLGMLLASTRGEPKTPAKVRATIEEALEILDDYSKQVRSISFLLYPPTLDESGLAKTLRWYVRGFRERSGISVDLDLPRDLGRLPLDVERTLYRVVQEGLANVLRHSGSRVAAVRLSLRPGAVTFVVEDEGRGMGRKRGGRSAGLGLRAIRDRIEELGGSLTIRSGKQGTRLTAVLPRPRSGEAEPHLGPTSRGV